MPTTWQPSQIPLSATPGGGRYYQDKHEVEARMVPAGMDAKNQTMIALIS